MNITLEIGTKNYLDDLLCIKKHLSHMESLLNCYASYTLSEPSSKFGWTFFKLEFKSNLQISISEKFSDILAKYQLNDEAGKFTKFMSDYFVARGCNVKDKICYLNSSSSFSTFLSGGVVRNWCYIINSSNFKSASC